MVTMNELLERGLTDYTLNLNAVLRLPSDLDFNLIVEELGKEQIKRA